MKKTQLFMLNVLAVSMAWFGLCTSNWLLDCKSPRDSLPPPWPLHHHRPLQHHHHQVKVVFMLGLAGEAIREGEEEEEERNRCIIIIIMFVIIVIIIFIIVTMFATIVIAIIMFVIIINQSSSFCSTMFSASSPAHSTRSRGQDTVTGEKWKKRWRETNLYFLYFF